MSSGYIVWMVGGTKVNMITPFSFDRLIASKLQWELCPSRSRQIGRFEQPWVRKCLKNHALQLSSMPIHPLSLNPYVWKLMLCPLQIEGMA